MMFPTRRNSPPSVEEMLADVRSLAATKRSSPARDDIYRTPIGQQQDIRMGRHPPIRTTTNTAHQAAPIRNTTTTASQAEQIRTYNGQPRNTTTTASQAEHNTAHQAVIGDFTRHERNSTTAAQ